MMIEQENINGIADKLHKVLCKKCNSKFSCGYDISQDQNSNYENERWYFFSKEVIIESKIWKMSIEDIIVIMKKEKILSKSDREKEKYLKGLLISI